MLGTANRDRKAERREATRLEIIDAAWEVAQELGLAQITLRAVAERVGMRAPSLYTHFDSKLAIYDAMFGQAWTECLSVFEATAASAPSDTRAALKLAARTFFDFAAANAPRHQLMNLRTIPGFEPSPAAYRPAVEALDVTRRLFAQHGITSEEDLNLFTALVGGLVDSQYANDPGGDRWRRLIDRAVDMFVDDLELHPDRSAPPNEETP